MREHRPGHGFGQTGFTIVIERKSGGAIGRTIAMWLGRLFASRKEKLRLAEWQQLEKPPYDLDTAECLLRSGFVEPAAVCARMYLEYVVRTACAKHCDSGGKIKTVNSLGRQIRNGRRGGVFTWQGSWAMNKRLQDANHAAHGGRLKPAKVSRIIAAFRSFVESVDGKVVAQ